MFYFVGSEGTYYNIISCSLRRLGTNIVMWFIIHWVLFKIIFITQQLFITKTLLPLYISLKYTQTHIHIQADDQKILTVSKSMNIFENISST